MSQLKIVEPTTKAQRTTRTTTDTWAFRRAEIEAVILPPFQRPLRHNKKMDEIAELIKVDDGIIPGVLTIGVLDGKRYLVDGQHRREAFFLSGCAEGCVDVRMTFFETMRDMAREFRALNSRIVNMKPDDILRAAEGDTPAVSKIRKACPFVGYDQIRRSEKAPILSMSAAIRCWMGSAHELPHTSGAAVDIAEDMTDDETTGLVAFLGCAFDAWGRNDEYARLWANLNLMLCMWLYRRLVVSAHSNKTKLISREQFTRCLMSLSAAEPYIDYLLNRAISKQSLGPTYDRIRGMFAGRLEHDTGKKPSMPSPTWGRAR